MDNISRKYTDFVTNVQKNEYTLKKARTHHIHKATVNLTSRDGRTLTYTFTFLDKSLDEVMTALVTINEHGKTLRTNQLAKFLEGTIALKKVGGNGAVAILRRHPQTGLYQSLMASAPFAESAPVLADLTSGLKHYHAYNLNNADKTALEGQPWYLRVVKMLIIGANAYWLRGMLFNPIMGGKALIDGLSSVTGGKLKIHTYRGYKDMLVEIWGQRIDSKDHSIVVEQN